MDDGDGDGDARVRIEMKCGCDGDRSECCVFHGFLLVDVMVCCVPIIT